MNVPKKHHFLSQFYLRGFCNPRGKLWVYDWVQSDCRSQYPSSIACENYLYALYDQSGGRDVSTEQMFAAVEAQAKPVIDKVERKEQLSQTDRDLVGCFAALAYTRVPARREEMLQRFQRLLATADVSSDGRKQAASDLAKQEFRQAAFIESMLKNGLEYAREFSAMDWLIARAPANKAFVTSDDPITPTAIETYDGPLEGIQLNTPGIAKAFPLTRNSLLVILDGGWSTTYIDVDLSFVRKMNCNKAFESKRFIFGSDEKLLRSLAREAVGVRESANC